MVKRGCWSSRHGHYGPLLSTKRMCLRPGAKSFLSLRTRIGRTSSWSLGSHDNRSMGFVRIRFGCFTVLPAFFHQVTILQTCAAAPQLAPSSGCLCGSNICTQGQICDGYAKYCTPACSTTALVETPCHCGGSEICGWNQFCSTANGSPKCIKNYSSGCFKNVSQCSDPVGPNGVHGRYTVSF